MKIRRRYVFVPLLSLIVITHLYNQDKTPVDRLQVPVDTNELPDYYMEGLEIRLFDDEGSLQANIISPSLIHYAGQKQAELDKPDIRLHAVNDQVWQIIANKGRILDVSQDIALEDSVSIKLGKPNTTSLLIETDNLYYEYLAHRAWNQNEVIFNRESASGRASGLLIDLNSEVFELHNNVEVRYKH